MGRSFEKYVVITDLRELVKETVNELGNVCDIESYNRIKLHEHFTIQLGIDSIIAANILFENGIGIAIAEKVVTYFNLLDEPYDIDADKVNEFLSCYASYLRGVLFLKGKFNFMLEKAWQGTLAEECILD